MVAAPYLFYPLVYISIFHSYGNGYKLINNADKRKNDCLKDADDSMSPVGQQPTTSQYISPSTIK